MRRTVTSTVWRDSVALHVPGAPSPLPSSSRRLVYLGSSAATGIANRNLDMCLLDFSEQPKKQILRFCYKSHISYSLNINLSSSYILMANIMLFPQIV